MNILKGYIMSVSLPETEQRPLTSNEQRLSILKDDFLLYTQRVSLELKLKTKDFKYGTAIYKLPFNSNNEPIVLMLIQKLILKDFELQFFHSFLWLLYNIVLRA